MADPDDFRSLLVDDTVYRTRYTRKFRERSPWHATDPYRLVAFIPGVIRKLIVQPGQRVRRGDALLVLEAMKMQNTVAAQEDGAVRSVAVKVGDAVSKGQLLVEMAP